MVSVILSKNVYMNMCPIPNGFLDRAISGNERPVPEGSWFKGRAGRLRINIQDCKHTFGE